MQTQTNEIIQMGFFILLFNLLPHQPVLLALLCPVQFLWLLDRFPGRDPVPLEASVFSRWQTVQCGEGLGALWRLERLKTGFMSSRRWPVAQEYLLCTCYTCQTRASGLFKQAHPWRPVTSGLHHTCRSIAAGHRCLMLSFSLVSSPSFIKWIFISFPRCKAWF